MPYFNRISIMGNLGRDPELRHFVDGTPTTTLSIAYSENWKDRNSEKESTEWFTAILYRKQAELVCQHMQKGDCIQVHGKLRSRTYEKNGEMNRIYEIIVDQMEIIRTNQQIKEV